MEMARHRYIHPSLRPSHYITLHCITVQYIDTRVLYVCNVLACGSPWCACIRAWGAGMPPQKHWPLPGYHVAVNVPQTCYNGLSEGLSKWFRRVLCVLSMCSMSVSCHLDPLAGMILSDARCRSTGQSGGVWWDGCGSIPMLFHMWMALWLPIATHDDQNQGLRLLTHTRNCVTPCMLKRRLSQKKVLRFRIPPIQDPSVCHILSARSSVFSSPCLRM